MYERILVALDHSAVSDRVLAAAKDLASMSGAKVWVLHLRERETRETVFGHAAREIIDDAKLHDANVIVMGVCLGAQLLAASLGAEVRAGNKPEVGVLPVEVTGPGRADPVFGVLGSQFPALQWHGDTFALPAGAVHLGRSAAYPNQAFRFGEAAYGIQFHVEVTDSMLAEWRQVPAYQRSAEAGAG